jgi:translocation and assembly module TamB
MKIEPIERAEDAVLRAGSRVQRFFRRHVPLAIGSIVVLSVLLGLELYFYASSEAFQNKVRQRLSLAIETAFGGRVEIGSFHWRLLSLEAEAGGVVIHGREASGEAPYARIEHLRAKVSILGIFSPSVRLSELEVKGPALHLIVYPDGETNQPHPRLKIKSSKTPIERLFDLKAGRVSVENGSFDIDNRAARFDFQDRHIPLDFRAANVTVGLSYVQAAAGAPESYRVEVGATDLSLVRGAGREREPEKHGMMAATVELTRAALVLREFRLTERDSGVEHTLAASGKLEDFAHPRWQATERGELDMALLEPATGYAFAPEGIAHLDLAAHGTAAEFAIDGRVHVDGGAYVGTGVVAHGITLDCRVHADQGRLLINEITARLKPGGEIAGTVDLRHWLPPSPSTPRLEPAALKVQRGQPAGQLTVAPGDNTIPVDGKVTAEFNNVTLDTLLDMVSVPPFQRLGIDALLNGPATANWTRGDNQTVVVSTRLTLSPSGRATAEAPANGVVDATYAHRDGSVEVRKLALALPESTLEAGGRIGAYPMTSATSLAVSLHSRRIEEFDTALRDLGVESGGRSGVSALPAHIGGQTDFTGTWTGSLLRPRIAGSARATDLAIEMVDKGGGQRLLNVDSAEASGSYSDQRISIDHAQLAHGAARLTVSGTLDATPETGRVSAAAASAYNRGSVLHVKVQASKVGIADLSGFTGTSLPATGTIDAGFEAHGTLSAPSGSGWAELDNGSAFGQPVERVHAQGTLNGSTLELAEVNASLALGSVTGKGQYDFSSERYEMNGEARGVELGQLNWVRQQGVALSGKLNGNVSGTGTSGDPRLDGRATVSGLVVNGEPLGSLTATAHTANRAAAYNVTTALAGAELKVNGQTSLVGDHQTENRLEFNRFDVGKLLKVMHVEGISGESALAGAATLAGPLDRPKELRGEVRLEQMALALSGIHMASEGGVHATLADGVVKLDPVHITGENTDLHAAATLVLTGDRHMDLAANGTIDLKVAETIDPDVAASGKTTFDLEAHGTLQHPGLRGEISVENGALALGDLPNGLSQMKGSLEFNQDRLEVRNLTAMTGGGMLSVGGSLTYQHGLYADLTATGKGVRIRYPEGLSSLADASLRLEGPRTNLLLSGDVLITRFAVSQDLDLTALATQAGAKAGVVAPPSAPSNHVRLDIHLASSPQLNFQNGFAKLAGNVDLRVRGTMASPSILGRISITEGSATIAGTRYELERGDITLTNPVRIEPVIDLTATAHVEDYDITLGLHGTPEKVAVSYRSDPPLPESDVVSLLALGHTENQQRLYTQQQEQEFSSPSTDKLLGGALNATMSSRVQKLFGAGSVKVDPDYLGAFGNSTSRVTVQEQLGRTLTLTYATDANTTSQQLLEADVAINRHVSLVVARDESGVFSMVLKATRRFK